MQIPLSVPKIVKSKIIELIEIENWTSVLLKKGLYELERIFYDLLLELYDNLCEWIVGEVGKSEVFEIYQRKQAQEKGLKKLVFRSAPLQLRTGTKIHYRSLYSKKVPEEYEGTRHLSQDLWRAEKGASPMYKSLNSLLSVICPSFDVAKTVLRHQGIKANADRVRQLSLSLSDSAMENRVSIQLEDQENMIGKKVIISIDGGRTRTKVYKEEKPSKREQKFDTPWREPKMFIITTIDEQGRVNKESLPIYDCSFGDEKTVQLLGKYLKRLQIEKAESVQVIADGAPWIWQQVIPMLVKQGVAKDKIIETLDYYHAVEHLNDMKVYFEKEEQDSYVEKLKESLWKGDIEQLGQLVETGIKGVDLTTFTPFKYFEKNKQRIDYQSLKEQLRPCGSGIIESGIRRIINLRFKSPSTFWFPENVEKLIFMRGVALAGRWEIMMNNLTKIQT